MTTERTGRFAWLAGLAWISMVGVVAAMGAVKWDQPGFRDQDISSAPEMALTMALVMALPLALVAGTVLAPLAWITDWISQGRLTLRANILIGACLSVPAAVGFFSAGWLVFGNGPRLLDNVRQTPDIAMGLLLVFAVGGVVISLAMRHRTAR